MDACLIYLGIFRILLGIGVGGDHPISASVTSDRSNIRKRGTMLSYIFSNRGWEGFVGSLVTIIVFLCYKNAMEEERHRRLMEVPNFFSIVLAIQLTFMDSMVDYR